MRPVLESLALLRCGVDALSASELDERLQTVRQGQAALDAVVVLIGRRADELAATGESGPAADVLLGQGQVQGRTARAEARRARLLSRVPDLEPTVAGGSLGGDHLESLARQTDSLSDGELAAVDVPHLAERAADLPADTFNAAVKRAIAGAAPAEPARAAAAKRESSTVRHWFDAAKGMGHLHAVLDPERYEAVATAIDQHTATLAATESEGGKPTPKNANLSAAALVELVSSSGARRAGRAHVTIVVDGATGAAQTGHGHDLRPEAVARLRCDSVEQRLIVDEAGLPLHVGRNSRTATNAQWTAIRGLYTSCGWAGCSRPLDWCQLHHIRPWSQGGSTDLDNLVPLCSEHHHRVHEGQWSIRLKLDRSLIMIRPDGNLHGSTAPPRRFGSTGPPPSPGGTPNPGHYRHRSLTSS